MHQETNRAKWEWDLATGEVFWDKGLEKIFGYSLAETPARIEWWYSKIHPEDRDRVVESTHAIIANPQQNSWVAEYRMRHAAGTWIRVMDRGVVSRDQDGQGIRMDGSMSDSSGRVQREEDHLFEVQRFAMLANLIPEIVWSATPDGHHDYANDQWYTYTATSKDSPLGSNWKDHLHPDDLLPAQEKWNRSIATGEPFDMQYRIRRASDGTYRWFIGKGMPLRDLEGKITRWFGTATDIDDQHSEEDRLEALVAKRTAQLEEHAAQLRGLAVALTSAEQRERARLADLLHGDLQQTLAAIRMRVNVVARYVQSTEGIREVEQANELVDEAIQTTRSLSRDLRPPALYEGGFETAIQWLSAEMEKRHHLKVTIGRLEEVHGVSAELKPLLFESIRELLFNAVKHAGVDQASVSAWEEHNLLRIAISDQGCGFDANIIFRAPNSTGSGLFSIRERLTALGGKLTVESAPGEGTRFEIEVPVHRKADQSATSSAPAQPCSARRLPVITDQQQPSVQDEQTQRSYPPDEQTADSEGAEEPDSDSGSAAHVCKQHFVQFYENDEALLQSLIQFIEEGLQAQEALVVIATAEHHAALKDRLNERGADVDLLRASDTYIALDAAETLSRFMTAEGPNEPRFIDTIEPIMMRAGAGGRPVRAFGEMVALLAAQGDTGGALRLEELWNELASQHIFALCCAYPLGCFPDAASEEALRKVCGAHAHVIPAESYLHEETDKERATAIVVLQNKRK